jgi:DNA-binding MarR family transcriptional regulator
MGKKTPLELTQELFWVMKRIPKPIFIRGQVEGLSRSEYELLVMLKMRSGDDNKLLSITEISNLLKITPAGVTHQINALEESGQIIRLPDPNDRRIVLIGLTDKGKVAAEALLSEIKETLIGLVNYLGEEDSQTLIRLMTLVQEYFVSRAVEN